MAPDSQVTNEGTPRPHADGVHTARPQPAARTVASASVSQAPTIPNGSLVLPLSVVSHSDVSRTLRELDKIDDYFHQASVRGSRDQALPSMSRTLDNLAAVNNLNLLHGDARSTLKEFLSRLKAKAPVVHISFPSEPSPSFLARILEWFRREAHPHVVLHVGLQPELAAGCLVRTTNKMMDFSFRKRFESSKQKLMAALEAMDSAPEATVVAESTATVTAEDRLEGAAQ